MPGTCYGCLTFVRMTVEFMRKEKQQLNAGIKRRTVTQELEIVISVIIPDCFDLGARKESEALATS